MICKKCQSEIEFQPSNYRGGSFKNVMNCKCESPLKINLCPMIKNSAEMNCRLIFVMRLLGIGYEGLNIFCSLMDMFHRVSKISYYARLKNIHTAASVAYDIALPHAVAREKDFNEEAGKAADALTLSGDGTWKKRRFSSLFGISTLIGKYSNKVLYACVMSSFCGECNLRKTL